jgi:hypothetical protein
LGRERDIRNAVVTALQATNQFNLVTVNGLPEEYGFGVDENSAAVIEPLSTAEEDRWDDAPGGGVIYKCDIVVTLLFRSEDPQARDEGAELLLDYTVNAISGQILVPGLTMPEFTKFTSWRWEKAVHPERRIIATLSVSYLIEGWDNLDTTP